MKRVRLFNGAVVMGPIVCLALIRSMAASAEAQIHRVVSVPDFGAERIVVVNRLGRVSIKAWDKPEVRISATKMASNESLARRLRVRLSRSDDAIHVDTFVRVGSVLPEPSRQALRELLLRQGQLLQLVVTSSSQARTETSLLSRLEQVDRELSRLRQRFASARAASAEISVPVRGAQLDLEIWLPRHLIVRASTFIHDLAVTGIRRGAELISEGGSVVVHDVQGPVRTRTQRGAQQLVGIRGDVVVEGGQATATLSDIVGHVRADLVSGVIRADKLVAKAIELRTINGQIHLAGPLRKDARYALVSVNGDLVLMIPPRSSAFLEGRAVRWDFGSFRPRIIKRGRKTIRAALGHGAPHVELATSNGEVRLVAE